MERVLVTDGFLIERCQRGDSLAFDQLMKRHEAKAYQYALKLTKHAEEARDVVSEGFIRVFRAINQFRSNSAFSTWLYRILRNCFLDMRKRKSLRIVASLDAVKETDEGDIQIQPIDQSRSPYDQAARREHSLQVRAAIQGLTEIQRSMIYLYHAEQMSYEEIASRLDLPVGTVKSRLNRARIALKDIFRKNPDLVQA
ncbi:MAG TPA: sigma-70 family RNA polymerase sigma factor [Fimbriimonadaceae bacterium]|nr:sigma-70 family RNA polymerase sigma factor [Fimbriimonadaceae bacterium]